MFNSNIDANNNHGVMASHLHTSTSKPNNNSVTGRYLFYSAAFSPLN